MSTTTPAAAAPRFEPHLMRRRLSGTLFLGACLAAIGILLIALLMLLVDVLARGLPWLDWGFLAGVPSRRPAAAGPSSRCATTAPGCPKPSARTSSPRSIA